MQLQKTLMGWQSQPTNHNSQPKHTDLSYDVKCPCFASKYGDNTAAIRQKAHLQRTSDMSLIGHRQLLGGEASRMLKRICLLTYHRNQVSTQCIPCLCAHTHAQCRSSVGSINSDFQKSSKFQFLRWFSSESNAKRFKYTVQRMFKFPFEFDVRLKPAAIPVAYHHLSSLDSMTITQATDAMHAARWRHKKPSLILEEVPGRCGSIGGPLQFRHLAKWVSIFL